MSDRSLNLLEINNRDLLQLTCRVFWSGATTAPGPATRWRHLMNCNNVSLDRGVTTRATKVVVGGLKRTAKSHTTELAPKFTLTGNEWTEEATRLALAADPAHDFGVAGDDNAQTGLSAVAGSAINATTAPIKKGERTQLYDAAGKRVYGVTAAVLTGALSAYGAAGSSATLAEDVDYVLDAQAGEIYWLIDVPNDTISTTLTTNAITASSANYATKIRSFLLGQRESYFMLRFYDQDERDDLALWSEDIFGSILASGTTEADGENDAEIPLEIMVYNDPTFYKRLGR